MREVFYGRNCKDKPYQSVTFLQSTNSLVFDARSYRPNSIYNWLTELGSMTQSLARYCQQVTVKLYQEGFILFDSQDEEAKLLTNSQRYWLREVVLLGDGCPWLYGQTVIPEETLTGPERELIKLGNVPLGK